MKKYLGLLTIVLCLSVTCIITLANDFVVYEAIEVDYPIIVNGIQKQFNLPIVSINNSTYLPLRAMCELLNIDINWNGLDKMVEINYQNSYDNEINNSNEDDVSQFIDFEISEDTALVLANDVFSQLYSEKYMEMTRSKVVTSTDNKYFIVYRYTESLVPGGGYEIYIRKADAKIEKIIETE